MKCEDCKRRQELSDRDGRTVWACRCAASENRDRIVAPGGGCAWRDPDDVAAVLYHVATADAVRKARTEGLPPAVGPRSSKAGETVPGIWFFRSPEDLADAVTNWLGDELPDEDLWVVTAALPGSYLGSLSRDGFETVCSRGVPPDYLDFQELDEWYAWASGTGVPAYA